MAVTLTARSIGLIVSTALAAGWLTASLTQPTAPAQTSAGSRRTVDVPPVPRAETLRDRLTAPPSPSRGRNPFVYGARPVTPSTRDHQQHGDEAVATPPPMPVIPPAPIFKLSGIASSSENGVAVLTAIVIDNGTMVFVKTGDKLSNGYSVVRIEETSATLIDASGVTQTLRLP
jgi:hypothetical protein